MKIIRKISALRARQVGFPYKGGTHFFLPEQIIRLQSMSNYTYIYTIDQKPILMAKVLGDYEALLQPHGFIRTHRSHLINRQHIDHVDNNGTIIMKDESQAEISRRKRKTVIFSLFNSMSAA